MATWIDRTKFGAILADPPWKYRNFKKAAHGAAASAMTTMTTEAIMAIPVARYAMADTLLAMWGVWPQMDDATDVMRAWGFSHITGFPWLKKVPSSAELRTGIGTWVQSTSEYCKLGRLGKPERREDAPKVKGCLVGEEMQFYAPIRKRKKNGKAHSVKPIEIHEYIERTCPGPYLELWATEERKGWTCIGDETGWKITPEGLILKKAW